MTAKRDTGKEQGVFLGQVGLEEVESPTSAAQHAPGASSAAGTVTLPHAPGASAATGTVTLPHAPGASAATGTVAAQHAPGASSTTGTVTPPHATRTSSAGVTAPDSPAIIAAFSAHLYEEEKSPATIEKYVREAERFLDYCSDRGIDMAAPRLQPQAMLRHRQKEATDMDISITKPVEKAHPAITQSLVVEYKEHLMERDYAAAGINAMLAGLRAFLLFLGYEDIRIKNLRIQRSPYLKEARILKRKEYERLVKTAKRNGQKDMVLILETIAGTGIRISELSYFTVDAIEKGEVSIRLKGKDRIILIPEKLRQRLLAYARKEDIDQGPIFRNNKGKPIHRSSVWIKMKEIAKAAGVALSKVFPHNLRRLFARAFYKEERDIAKLADVLGHSSIDTTRLYIRTGAMEHRRCLEGLGLIL